VSVESYEYREYLAARILAAASRHGSVVREPGFNACIRDDCVISPPGVGARRDSAPEAIDEASDDPVCRAN